MTRPTLIDSILNLYDSSLLSNSQMLEILELAKAVEKLVPAPVVKNQKTGR